MEPELQRKQQEVDKLLRAEAQKLQQLRSVSCWDFILSLYRMYFQMYSILQSAFAAQLSGL